MNYEALKDFIRWSSPEGYDLDEIYKVFIPILTEISNHVASVAKPQS